MADLFERTRELCRIPSAPGFEHDVVAWLLEAFRPYADEVEVDTMGNLYALRQGDPDGPTLMISAHSDEIGGVIRAVEPDGFLRFNKLGGVLDSLEVAARHPGFNFEDVPAEEPIEVFEEQAKRGMDIITIHASLRHEHVPLIQKSARVIPITSKGGGIIAAFMKSKDCENPYHEHFDMILEISARHGVTLSLGTSLRTGTVCDNWDSLLAREVDTKADLVSRANDAGVNIMVEGMGHVAIDVPPFSWTGD